jgi:hypothetical protein
MLSYDLWQSRYGGDPRIVGHTIRIDAQAATVIGVMPRDFSFPRREELWVASPLSLTGTSDHYSYWVVLRRHADAQPAAVAAALEAWFAEAARAQPAIFRGAEPRVEPLARMTMDPATRSLFGLLACAALIVLAISCANAANLMLMRAMDERRNLALHVALGATRSRLVTRVLMQSVLLGGVAAGTALLLATVAANWQDGAMHQSEFALRWVHLSIGPTVIALALVTGIAAASIASVLPALTGRGFAQRRRSFVALEPMASVRSSCDVERVAGLRRCAGAQRRRNATSRLGHRPRTPRHGARIVVAENLFDRRRPAEDVRSHRRAPARRCRRRRRVARHRSAGHVLQRHRRHRSR